MNGTPFSKTQHNIGRVYLKNTIDAVDNPGAIFMITREIQYARALYPAVTSFNWTVIPLNNAPRKIGKKYSRAAVTYH